MKIGILSQSKLEAILTEVGEVVAWTSKPNGQLLFRCAMANATISFYKTKGTVLLQGKDAKRYRTLFRQAEVRCNERASVCKKRCSFAATRPTKRLKTEHSDLQASRVPVVGFEAGAPSDAIQTTLLSGEYTTVTALASGKRLQRQMDKSPSLDKISVTAAAARASVQPQSPTNVVKPEQFPLNKVPVAVVAAGVTLQTMTPTKAVKQEPLAARDSEKYATIGIERIPMTSKQYEPLAPEDMTQYHQQFVEAQAAAAQAVSLAAVCTPNITTPGALAATPSNDSPQVVFGVPLVGSAAALFSGFGDKIMRALGWKEGEGLGKEGCGRKDLVLPKNVSWGQGVGCVFPCPPLAFFILS